MEELSQDKDFSKISLIFWADSHGWEPSLGDTFKRSPLSEDSSPALRHSPSSRGVRGALDSHCQGEGRLYTCRQCDLGISVTMAAKKGHSCWLWGTWLLPEPCFPRAAPGPPRARTQSRQQGRTIPWRRRAPPARDSGWAPVAAWPRCSLICAAAQGSCSPALPQPRSFQRGRRCGLRTPLTTCHALPQ